MLRGPPATFDCGGAEGCSTSCAADVIGGCVAGYGSRIGDEAGDADCGEGDAGAGAVAGDYSVCAQLCGSVDQCQVRMQVALDYCKVSERVARETMGGASC